MDFILFAVGLGYLQVGSNLLQRDMTGVAMNRPLYMSSGASQFQHYAFTILLWPLIRLAHRPRGSSPPRTLGYCAIQVGFIAIVSAMLMAAVSLLTGNVAAQALFVLGLYASCYREDHRLSGEASAHSGEDASSEFDPNRLSVQGAGFSYVVGKLPSLPENGVAYVVVGGKGG